MKSVLHCFYRSESFIILEPEPVTNPLHSLLLATNEPKLDTLDSLFRFCCKRYRNLQKKDNQKLNFPRYGPNPGLGHREVFREEQEVQADGKILTKLVQGEEYLWQSYQEIDARYFF